MIRTLDIACGAIALWVCLSVQSPRLSAALVETGEVAPSITSWDIFTVGTIGFNNAGNVLVDGGSILRSRIIELASNPGSIGTVMVTGAGSQWISGGHLVVGHAGSSTLMIEAGGKVSNTNSHLGRLSGSSGTATVAGVDSTWTNNGTLYVGESGNGTLLIDDGGKVSSANGYLGRNTGALGVATITGAGSQWINSGTLFGNGMLTVADGGEVVAAELYASPSDMYGNGTIRATNGAVLDADLLFDAMHGNQQNLAFGSGGTLDVNWSGGALGVGYRQAGSLIVSEGVNIASDNGYLGYRPDSTGMATVTGDDSKWTNSSSLYVGNSGSGSLIIEAGGQVSNTTGYLGRNLGSAGTATVTGAGSQWSNNGGLNIGEGGNGSLIIAAGGQVSNTFCYLGRNPGSTGMVIVTGAGSNWTNGSSIYVGRSGNGTLTIEAGGQFSNTIGYVGSNFGGTGTATVTGAGSRWTNSGTLTVSEFGGSGTLNIVSGGLVSVGAKFSIDIHPVGDGFLNMATGGMLALQGDADDSLSQFLGLIEGTDAIRFWDFSLSDWAPLTAATYGDDFTLSYITEGDLTGSTLLTVGRVGDFDGDGDVDGRDFLAWQRNPSLGDLADWQAAYGTSSSPGANFAVPEPDTCLLPFILTTFGLVVARNLRRVAP